MKVFTVDAFSKEPFKGNPAGVCLLNKPKPLPWMLNIAAELRHSETAFVLRNKDRSFNLRWCTPTKEVPLCGHATLATAHVLWEEGVLPRTKEARLHTLSGILIAKKVGEQIELDFPVDPIRKTLSVKESKVVLSALGYKPLFLGKARSKILAELATEKDVERATPRIDLLKALNGGLVITARASKGKKYDFVSRYFVPSWGIDEDPVTGATHCILAPYWSKKIGKSILNSFQASSRGGYMQVEQRGDRVFLRGKATTIWRGDLLVP